VELYFYSPNTPPWRDAQLKKSTVTALSLSLSLSLPLPIRGLSECEGRFLITIIGLRQSDKERTGRGLYELQNLLHETEAGGKMKKAAPKFEAGPSRRSEEFPCRWWSSTHLRGTYKFLRDKAVHISAECFTSP
jgi:hypothetical protein